LKGRQLKIEEMIFLIIINEYKAYRKNNIFIPHLKTGINNKLYGFIGRPSLLCFGHPSLWEKKAVFRL